jgi:mgtE-like transporter
MLLGTSEPVARPDHEARRDIWLLFVIAVPVYLFNAVGAQLVSQLLGLESPGWGQMIAASLIAGLGGLLFVAAMAYYSTVVAVRTGLDPDTYGIPLVSSFVDFGGAVTLIITLALLGIG